MLYQIPAAKKKKKKVTNNAYINVKENKNANQSTITPYTTGMG